MPTLVFVGGNEGLVSGESHGSVEARPGNISGCEGGVMEDEMLLGMPSRYLLQMLAGLEARARKGLRYPVPSDGVQSDVGAGLGFSYGS